MEDGYRPRKAYEDEDELWLATYRGTKRRIEMEGKAEEDD
jgi:hypothetical protein